MCGTFFEAQDPRVFWETLIFSGLSATWDLDQNCKAIWPSEDKEYLSQALIMLYVLMKDWDRVKPCVLECDFNICIQHLLANELLEICISLS